MIEEFRNEDHEKDETTVALLRRSQALPPAGFAARAARQFAAAVEKRRLRRLIAVSAVLFAISSATTWILLLNVQNAAGSTWAGLVSLVSFVEVIYTLWQRLPFVCGTVTFGLLVVALCTGGLLRKVQHRDVLVK